MIGRNGEEEEVGDEQKCGGGNSTRRAPLFVVLLPRPRQLEEGKEAERVPVQVTVWAQLRPLPRWGVEWGEAETQVVFHLYRRVRRKKGEDTSINVPCSIFLGLSWLFLLIE